MLDKLYPHFYDDIHVAMCIQNGSERGVVNFQEDDREENLKKLNKYTTKTYPTQQHHYNWWTFPMNATSTENLLVRFSVFVLEEFVLREKSMQVYDVTDNICLGILCYF